MVKTPTTQDINTRRGQAMPKYKTKRHDPPTLDEVLKYPPLPDDQLSDFYDLQDILGIHWFKRPKK